MGQAQKQELYVEKFGENLSTFAINRDDVKELLSIVPVDLKINLTTIEYELQLLKIISVGWAISLYMEDLDKNKKILAEIFWSHIREMSKNISNLTGVTTGQQIDYFEILKTRLTTYVEVLQKESNKTTDTQAVMGSTFAQVSKLNNNAQVILIGTKMFTFTLGAVKEYLNSVNIKENKNRGHVN